MAVFKCKMCGGDLNIEEGMTVAECAYCGTKQTIPLADDEKKLNLFNRANRLRRTNEFDKAASLYESIIAEFPEESEAYWGLCLCNYGIEYVDDPLTKKKIPTCHRASFESLQKDENFKLALEYGNISAQAVLRTEAREIDRIMEEILSVSRNEKPYDVFICYKEKDENGGRTQDSVIAQDIYDVLTEKGLKVFFSRISLEDKLGTAYEPYIFAALNSSRVMLAVGTKFEYFNAVWVKNEWSRFLKLMQKDKSKVLIPCFKDMDAYDIPEEFSHLQAQDMGKIGFMQDLVRGVKKIAGTEDAPVVKEVIREVSQNTAAVGADSLLERAFIFLEDQKWQDADTYCEKVLDIDPKNARAYLGKLMADLHIRQKESLKNCAMPFDNYDNYNKVMRFGDKELTDEISGYIAFINDRNETSRKEKIYLDAVQKMHSTARDSENFRNAAKLFESIIGYKDSKELLKSCAEKAVVAENDKIYNDAVSFMKTKSFRLAEKEFNKIPEWKDSAEKAQECHRLAEIQKQEREEAIAAAEKEEKAHNKKMIIAAVSIFTAIILILSISFSALFFFNSIKYNKASDYMEEGNYEEAISLYTELGDYKDSQYKITMCRSLISEKDNIDKYNAAVKLMEEGRYEEAISVFAELEGYSDSAEKIKECKYILAEHLAQGGETAKAAMLYGAISGYKDAREKSFSLWDKIAVRETIGTGTFRTDAVKNDGTILSVGDEVDLPFYLTLEEAFGDPLTISSGEDHIICIKEDGTVAAAGENTYGQCNVSDWSDIVSVSAGEKFSVGLKSDGTVVAVGENTDRQCNVSDWSDIVSVSAGEKFSVGLKSDGTVVAVGDNKNGQCDVTGWTDIVAISAGDYHTVGLKSDGTVVAVGYNLFGQCDISDWSDIMAISVGAQHTVGLRNDGTVVVVGSNEHGQCNVSDWTDIIAISAGGYHTVGLKSDGTVVAVGHNLFGQCDITDWQNIKLP